MAGNKDNDVAHVSYSSGTSAQAAVEHAGTTGFSSVSKRSRSPKKNAASTDHVNILKTAEDANMGGNPFVVLADYGDDMYAVNTMMEGGRASHDTPC